MESPGRPQIVKLPEMTGNELLIRRASTRTPESPGRSVTDSCSPICAEDAPSRATSPKDGVML